MILIISLSTIEGDFMKWCFAFLSYIFSLSASADQFISTVHSLDIGKGKEDHFVRFDNGRVTFIKGTDKNMIQSLINVEKHHRYVLVVTDKRNNLQAIQSIQASPEELSEDVWSKSSGPYRPRVLKNSNEALKVFNQMRKDYTKDGECYSRAHIWAYEEHQRSKMNLMKIFMFFTERYIRNYKFHWWFHVTPMVYVANFQSPRTLDRRYSGGPRQTLTWSNTFVKTQRRCKIVTKFDDYWLNQETQDCYHIYSSMYYVIPRDLEKRDLTGQEKTDFIEREIKRAYRDGFNKDML